MFSAFCIFHKGKSDSCVTFHMTIKLIFADFGNIWINCPNGLYYKNYKVSTYHLRQAL